MAPQLESKVQRGKWLHNHRHLTPTKGNFTLAILLHWGQVHLKGQSRLERQLALQFGPGVEINIYIYIFTTKHAI